MEQLDAASRCYLFPFVCIDCRKAFKRPLSKESLYRPCPICGEPAIRVARKFKAPKANDLKQWEKVRLLVEHGFFFQSIYDGRKAGLRVPYPKSLPEAREWIEKWRHLAAELPELKPSNG